MGKKSQRKGADGERELVDVLNTAGYNVQRGGSQTYGEIPDLVGLPGIHIECKRTEKLNIHEAMQQSRRDADRFQDGMPAVFHRRNRTGWLVTMDLGDWLRIYGDRMQ